MSSELQVAATATATAAEVEVAPIDELSALVTWGAALFYWAEEGQNPGVKTYWDAFHYIATSLSVGYANMFPVTPLGKMIGGVVMMVGPALSARAFEPAHPEGAVSQGQVVEKLDAILEELKKLNAGR
jgi:hypothetical protein